MIRVLQLVDVDPDYQTEAGARQLSADSSGVFRSETRTIGRGGGYSTVLSAIIAQRRAGERFDLVHAWGPRALVAAALGSRSPMVYSPDTFPSRRQIRLVRAIRQARDMHIAAPTDSIRRAFVTRGVPVERCHLIRPGVEFAKINRRRDPKLRQALELSSDDYMILACGESTRQAAHQLAVWSATILHVLDRRNRLLLWGRGDHAAQAHRFAVKTRQHDLIKVGQRELGREISYEELLPAADCILITATGPVSTLPVAISMAAALPIVAVVTPTIAELLEDRHTALLVGNPKPRLIAQRLLDVKQDPSLQWSIADMARSEAYEYFSLTRMLEQYRSLYRQIAEGRKVELPLPVAGAGLRFHGRG